MVNIYRDPAGIPPKTKFGDCFVGQVYTLDEKAAEPYLRKGFVTLTDAQAAAVRAGKPLPAADAGNASSKEARG